MATALRYLGATDGYIPQATGQVIAYVRRESDFPLNRYVQYVPTKTSVGVFAILGRDEFVRVTSDNDYAWEDGDPRPMGEIHKVPFVWQEFRTFRRDYPWTIGYKALEQAKYGSWQPKPVHMAAAISKAMTNRTNRVATLLTTVSNWPATNTADANTLNSGAGKWPTGSDDPNSLQFEAIYKSLVQASRAVNVLTNAVVKPVDLQVVIGPDLAIAMSSAPEIVNYVRESPYAKEFILNGLDPQYNLWGIPQTYRGFKFVVDDTPIVLSRPNTTSQSGTPPPPPVEGALSSTARQYVYPANKAILVSRVGGLDGDYGAPSFSTVQLYHYGGLMEVEAFEDPRNRRIDGHVSEDYKEVLAAAYAGYLITNTV